MASFMLMVAGASPSTAPRTLPMAEGCSGELTIQRNGQAVTLVLNGVEFPAGSGRFILVPTGIPAGFRPPRNYRQEVVAGGAGGTMNVLSFTYADISWEQQTSGSGARPTGKVYAQAQWLTNDAWPTS
ncbi:hypothetical protein U6G28_08735 [Actinomycetaceae bacterium MB13-C1-2]|nr:hypothetical protein U6G28_08735 [Actinomycetaceae bacterium MB13-C1-2]